MPAASSTPLPDRMAWSMAIPLWLWPAALRSRHGSARPRPQKGVQGIVAEMVAEHRLRAGHRREGAASNCGSGTAARSEKVRSGRSSAPANGISSPHRSMRQPARLRLHQAALSHFPQDAPAVSWTERAGTASARRRAPSVLAALALRGRVGGRAPRTRPLQRQDRPPGHLRAGPDRGRIRTLETGAIRGRLEGLVALWDFSVDIPSRHASDLGPHRLHGRAVNMPMRAVTGHNWHGEEIRTSSMRRSNTAPSISTTTTSRTPAGRPISSGRFPPTCGAASMPRDCGTAITRTTSPSSCGRGAACHAPRRSSLLPTFTYLAYANETHKAMPRHQAVYTKRAMVKDRLDLYLAEHREFGISLYDVHSDGSGCCYSSHLRPIPSLRPKYRQWQVGWPRHLAADLYLVDWLEAEGHRLRRHHRSRPAFRGPATARVLPGRPHRHASRILVRLGCATR